MSRTATCPGEDVLERLLDGSLPDRDGKWVQRHLEACGACQERIEALMYDRYGNPRSIPCPAPSVIRRFLDGTLEDHASEVVGHHTDSCRSCAAILEALANGEDVHDVTSSCPPEADLRRLVAGTLAEDRQAALEGHLDGCEACRARLDALAGGDGLPGRMEELRSAVADDPGLKRVIGALKDSYGTGPGAATGTLPASGVVPPTELLGLLDPPVEPGDLGRIGPYRVLEVLGSGGMGIVFRGFDPALNRPVAIKVLAPQLATSGTARQRFAREARAAAAIRNEHVVAIHSVDEWRGLPYLVMEFIPGRSLQDRIEDAPLDPSSILRIGMQAAAGLAAAHAQGLVHRDVKPSNILLENCVERVKITDFGLARAADDASLTHSGFVAGTPLFMAPEQARGDALDHRADLFSLGVVLYAMCTGRSPFRASTTLAVLKRVCDDTHRPIRETNPDIPESLCRIIDRLLTKEPSERFQSAEEVARVLADRLAARQRGEAEESRRSVPDDSRAGHYAAGTSFPQLDDVGPAKGFSPRSGRYRWLVISGSLVITLAAVCIVASDAVYTSRWIWPGVAESLRLRERDSQVVVRVPDPSFGVRIDGRPVLPVPGTGMCVRTVRPGRILVDIFGESIRPGRRSFLVTPGFRLELLVASDSSIKVLDERPLYERADPFNMRDLDRETRMMNRVRESFLSDPEVASLVAEIKRIKEEVDYAKTQPGPDGAPNLQAAMEQLTQLQQEYNRLWPIKSEEIHRRLQREEAILTGGRD